MTTTFQNFLTCSVLMFLGKRLLRSLKTSTILVVFQIAQNHITWITLVWTEAVYGSNSLACHWQKPLDFNEVVLDMYFYNFTLSTSQIYHNFIVGLSSLVNATRENPLFPNLFLAFIKSRQPWFSWTLELSICFKRTHSVCQNQISTVF